MIDEISESDIIFFGEIHNNPISHWLQLEITEEIFKIDSNLVLGFEMFESDNQLLLDEFLNDLISEEKFEDETRLWNNYKTDYKPLITFAKENELQVIASNIPRRYASLVFRNGLIGLEALTDEAKSYIAPLPIEFDPEVDAYKNMLNMMHSKSEDDSTRFYFPMAQAVKDATMAWFIKQNYEKGGKIIHFNGAYHSDNYEGIIWYLQKYMPDVSIKTITTIETEDVEELNEKNIKADFNILVVDNMTKTY
jgi:uncharacterized iron-regulated protein